MKTVVVRLALVCASISLIFVGLINARIDLETCAGMWLFDDGKGDIAKDSSGNQNDGMLKGGPKWVDGKFGGALELIIAKTQRNKEAKMFKKVLTIAFAIVFMCALAFGLQAKAQIVTDGLVSYWSFDKNTIKGDTVEDGFGNNDGTIKGNPEIVSGKVGEALLFDGDDYVGCGKDSSLLLGDTDLSFGVWFNADVLDDKNYLVGNFSAQNGKYYHLWEHDGELVWSIDDNVTKTEIRFGPIEKGQWYYAVGVRVKGKETRLYVNGVLQTSAKDQTGDITSDAPMYFGDRFAGERAFEGRLDEVALYSRALSDDEIKNNMNAKGMAVAANADKLAITWGTIKCENLFN